MDERFTQHMAPFPVHSSVRQALVKIEGGCSYCTQNDVDKTSWPNSPWKLLAKNQHRYGIDDPIHQATDHAHLQIEVHGLKHFFPSHVPE